MSSDINKTILIRLEELLAGYEINRFSSAIPSFHHEEVVTLTSHNPWNQFQSTYTLRY